MSALLIPADQLPLALDRLIDAAAEQGTKMVAGEAFTAALARSSGGFSSEQLAEMDHPYATRHGYPRLDPATINVQTGVFRSSWNQVQAGPAHWQVRNDDPKADKVLEGDFYVFGRPIDEAVERDTPRLLAAPDPFR